MSKYEKVPTQEVAILSSDSDGNGNAKEESQLLIPRILNDKEFPKILEFESPENSPRNIEDDESDTVEEEKFKEEFSHIADFKLPLKKRKEDLTLKEKIFAEASMGKLFARQVS
jgi:hypothetical protein